MTDKAPLEGIRVVEWLSDACSDAVGLAIGLAGRIAADLGAEILQIDAPAIAARRQCAPLIEGIGATALFLDRNKRRIPAALFNPGATATAADGTPLITIYLADAANHTALALQGAHSLALTSDRAAATAAPDTEFTLLAVGGLLDLVGDIDRQPMRLGGHQLAYSAGLALYAGIAAEIGRRRDGGAPDTLHVNLADVAVWLNWKSVASATLTNRLPTRLGDGAEWRTIRCKDGWVALVYLEADWAGLKTLVNDPRLDDPRYDDRLTRRREATIINAIVEAAFLTYSRNDLRALALARRLPLGPVWSPAELEHDPHYVAREFLRRVPGETGTTTLQPALPVMWNGHRFDGPTADVAA